MFPPFIDSFGNQFTAVLINTFGTVFGAMISSLFSSFVTSFVTPFFQSLAGSIGLG